MKNEMRSPQRFRFSLELALYALLFPMVIFFFSYFEPFASWLIGSDVSAQRQIIRGFMLFCLQYWWIPLLALLMVTLLSLVFSHRIFGPIYRLRLNLERLMSGEKTVSFKLRDGDYFQDFSSLLSECLQGIEVSEHDQTPPASEREISGKP
jgi:hypothetical protein